MTIPLLAILQMPPGIPVGTLAIGKPGAKNSAMLAVTILALSDETIAANLEGFRAEQTQSIVDMPRPELRNRISHLSNAGCGHQPENPDDASG